MSAHFRMNAVDWTALALVIVGAVNWGLVGVGYFLDANLNLVNIIFGSIPALEAVVYLVVGLSAIYTTYLATRLAGVDIPEPTMETAGRKQAK